MPRFVNKKDAFLPRTPLDYLVEAVEAEFGSIREAPDYAMKPIWSYVKRHHMGVYDRKIQKDNSTRMAKRQHKRFPKRKDARGGKMVPTKIWQADKDKKWYTNNKRIVRAVKILRHNPKFTITKACYIAHCAPKFISNYPINHHYFVYTCGPKKIKAYSRSMLIGKCKKTKFPFAPMNFNDLENDRYMGTIKKYHYYGPVYYKKVSK